MHYNPFKHLSDRASAGDSDYDKFYAEDFAETFNCTDRASKNLEKCSYHKIKSKFLAEFNNEDVCDFKTLFYNRLMCLILTIQGVFLDFCLINSNISQWIALIEMKPLQALN